MERGLRAKMKVIDDFYLPEHIDFSQFMNIENQAALRYLSIAYKEHPQVRSLILKEFISVLLSSLMKG